MKKVLVTGDSGMIGHHLVNFLKKKRHFIRGVDIKKHEYSTFIDENYKCDLRDYEICSVMIEGMDEVYNLAANMGGIGFISEVNAEILHDNVLINTNIAQACLENEVKKIFFSSSACVYPEHKQTDADVSPLKEFDAYPASPNTEYGWEKLFSERLFLSYQKDYGLDVRIARFHNVFGPECTYDGGREKSPAAICRKIAKAKDGDEIEIWGDGKQTRSYCFIDDCLEGIYKLMESDYNQPLNIGSDRLVTIDEMVDIVCKIAGKNLKKKYLLDKPQGVRGRNADLTLCKQILNWEPKISLEDGLAKTYHWINQQING